MRIAIHEPFPVLEELLKKDLAPRVQSGTCFVEAAKTGGVYDLLLSDRSWLPREEELRAELYLMPGGNAFPCREITGPVLTGGMSRADPVTLSSIGEERAMLCLQQEIRLCGKWIAPFERPIPFDRRYNLYKNLAAGFACALEEILSGEE